MDRNRISRSMGQVHSIVPLHEQQQQSKQVSSSNGALSEQVKNLSTQTEIALQNSCVENESHAAAAADDDDDSVEEANYVRDELVTPEQASLVPSISSLDNDNDEPLPFLKASNFGSRRRDDDCLPTELTDVLKFFEDGDSSFSDATLIKRWVGGSSSPSSAIQNSMSTPSYMYQQQNQLFGHSNGKNQKGVEGVSSVNSSTDTPLMSTSTEFPLRTVQVTSRNSEIEVEEAEVEETNYCNDPLFPKHGRPVIVIGGQDDIEDCIYSKQPSKGSTSSGTREQVKCGYQITQRKEKLTKDLELEMSKSNGNQALGLVLSALYGKLLVVMGIAFPMSEVISTFIPPSFYDGFYLYLYFGSITFMICIYGNVVSQTARRSVRNTMQRIHSMRIRLAATNFGIQPDVTTTDARQSENYISSSDGSEGSCVESAFPINSSKIDGFDISSATGFHCNNDYAYQRIHFGSFYLRMGAVAFGIGSMIYSGLEFGQYFELEPDTKCHNFMIALTPAVRMIFTFMQMYFIFMNSKLVMSKVRQGQTNVNVFVLFGLMHQIACNLCVWLNVLVQETRHEILNFYNPDNYSITQDDNNINFSGESSAHYDNQHRFDAHNQGIPKDKLAAYSTSNETSDGAEELLMEAISHVLSSNVSSQNGVLGREKRGLRGPHSLYECRRTDIMGSLVQNASPFLFPCTIEYSLICAAILYVMWKNMYKCQAAMNRNQLGQDLNDESQILHGAKRSPHQYSVDCARANKGLFLGIFVLVMTIISLILYFVLITRPEYQYLATLEVNITELILYTTTTVAVLIGMCQIRELRFVLGRNLELDNILLIVAQTGSFIYNVFTVIGGHFTLHKNTVLVMMTALSSLIQLLFQTLFILDASKRCAATTEQVRRKPGREVVTFLLVTNLAMWAINTLEKSRADSDPVQLKFYGVWAWTILIHLSMPLAIFYRFHSTVCLCEIWKKAYKLKPT